MNQFLLTQLKFVSLFGDVPKAAAVFLLIVCLYFIYLGHKRSSLFLLLSLLSYPYSVILKAIFKAERPDTAVLLHRFYGLYSFPSSHVVVYTVLWGFLIYLVLTLSKVNIIVRYAITLVGIYFIVLVGASRVVLGQHFLQDVIGGYIFGIIFLFALIKLHQYSGKSMSKN